MKRVVLGGSLSALGVALAILLPDASGLSLELSRSVDLKCVQESSGAQVLAWPLFEKPKAHRYLPPGARLLDLSQDRTPPVAFRRSPTVLDGLDLESGFSFENRVPPSAGDGVQVEVCLPPIDSVKNLGWCRESAVDVRLAWQARVLGTNRERLVDLDYRGSARYVGSVRIVGLIPSKSVASTVESMLLSRVEQDVRKIVEGKVKSLAQERKVDDLVCWAVGTEPSGELEESRWKELLDALNDGDLETLKRSFEAEPKLLQCQDSFGRTLLHHAADQSPLRVVRWLVENGAPLDATDNLLRPAWHIALVNQARLRRSKPLRDVEARTEQEQMIRQQAEVLDYLLTQNPELDARDRKGATALHLLGGDRSDLALARRLLASGLAVDLQDNRGRSALSYALEEENVEYASLLLKAGADLSLPDFEGKCPKDYATGPLARLFL